SPKERISIPPVDIKLSLESPDFFTTQDAALLEKEVAKNLSRTKESRKTVWSMAASRISWALREGLHFVERIFMRVETPKNVKNAVGLASAVASQDVDAGLESTGNILGKNFKNSIDAVGTIFGMVNTSKSLIRSWEKLFE